MVFPNHQHSSPRAEEIEQLCGSSGGLFATPHENAAIDRPDLPSQAPERDAPATRYRAGTV
jgi:hypothetical protein